MTDRASFRPNKDGAPPAMLGGGVLIAQAILTVLFPPAEHFAGGFADYLAESLFVIGLALTLPGLLLLRERLTGRLSAVGGAFAALGQSAVLLSVLVTLIKGREALDLLYIAGFAIWLVGLLALSVSAVRQSSTLRATVALIPATILAIAMFTSAGTLVLGAVWIVLATRLRRSRFASTAARVAASSMAALTILGPVGCGSSSPAKHHSNAPSTIALHLSRSSEHPDRPSTQGPRQPRGRTRRNPRDP